MALPSPKPRQGPRRDRTPGPTWQTLKSLPAEDVPTMKAGGDRRREAWRKKNRSQSKNPPSPGECKAQPYGDHPPQRWARGPGYNQIPSTGLDTRPQPWPDLRNRPLGRSNTTPGETGEDFISGTAAIAAPPDGGRGRIPSQGPTRQTSASSLCKEGVTVTILKAEVRSTSGSLELEKTNKKTKTN